MKRFVPHDIDYKFLNRIDSYLNNILIISGIIALITLVIDLTKILGEYNEIIQVTLNSITCILAMGYFTLDIFFNHFFQSSEIKRRKDFIDNSLRTQLSEVNSTGYYSNDSIDPGILKLGINCFENSLFTKNNSALMFFPMILKMSAVIFVFLLLALFSDNKVITTILQITLPLTIIQQTLKLYFFKNKMQSIYDQFQYIFTSADNSSKYNLIIHNVINYESTLAWGSILLDSKIFANKNDEWTRQWENIKTRLNLEEPVIN